MCVILYLTLVLICISSIPSKVEHHIWATHTHKHINASDFPGWFALFLVISRSHFYIVGAKPLLVTCIADIFSWFVSCLSRKYHYLNNIYQFFNLRFFFFCLRKFFKNTKDGFLYLLLKCSSSGSFPGFKTLHFDCSSGFDPWSGN